jgi:hypothetical protein
MKKIILTAVFALIINVLSALPTFICTSGGFLFYCYWYYDSQGNLAYMLESQGAGSCTGGPWVMKAFPHFTSDDDNNGLTIASNFQYNNFQTFNIPANKGSNEREIQEAINLTTLNSECGNLFDPEIIHPNWAKSIAISNKLSVFTLKLKCHPFHDIIKFDIWSVKNQLVNLSISNQLNGNKVFSSEVNLIEGKNTIDNIQINSLLSGNYKLRITSDLNSINRNIIIQ